MFLWRFCSELDLQRRIIVTLNTDTATEFRAVGRLVTLPNYLRNRRLPSANDRLLLVIFGAVFHVDKTSVRIDVLGNPASPLSNKGLGLP
jgi:hypothetical protein